MRSNANENRRTGIGWLTPLVFVVPLVAAVFLWLFNGKDKTTPGITISSSPTIERLQSMGDLVVMRAHIADVLVAEGEGYKGSWLIKGDGLIAVNLREATMTQNQSSPNVIKIGLPQPRVIQPRVNHDKTRTWQVEKKDWFPGDQGKLRDEAMKQGQSLIEVACRNTEILEQSKTNAALLLKNVYSVIGYEVEIVWATPAP